MYNQIATFVKVYVRLEMDLGMKKGWVILGLLMLLVVGGGAGTVSAISYGSNDTLPEGVSVGGLEVGGKSPEAALSELRKRVSEIENTAVSVSSSDSTKTLKQLGFLVDLSEATKAIEDYRDASWLDRAIMRYQNEEWKDYNVTMKWNDEQLRKEVDLTWNPGKASTPKNATRVINDRDEVVYTPEEAGSEVDVPALLARIKELTPKDLSVKSEASSVQTHSVELPIIITSPEVTVASLKEEGIERKIAEFTTAFATSGEGRSHNVTVAAQALNETLLMPDEVFEYGKIVAKAEQEYGYKEAPVILKGKLTPGIGGGICQVSSTLYNAALLTGLEIVERRNHSLVVSYLPKGLDATFADGYVNFKFRNTTGKQLLIRTVVKDKTVTVKLFGTMPDNVSYRTETQQVKVNLPKTVYVANDKIALGKQEVLQKGEPGYVVESYLVKMIDGEFVERKMLSKDTYRTQDLVVEVNPQDVRLLPEGTIPTPDAIPAPNESPAPENAEEGPVEPV